MDINKIIVWLVVGTFAGTLAGRLLTFSKKGFGFWSNIGVGMVGAVVGGLLFWMFRINLGLGEMKISLEDVVSAFVGSLLCVLIWKLIRKPKPDAK